MPQAQGHPQGADNVEVSQERGNHRCLIGMNRGCGRENRRDLTFGGDLVDQG